MFHYYTYIMVGRQLLWVYSCAALAEDESMWDYVGTVCTSLDKKNPKQNSDTHTHINMMHTRQEKHAETFL